MFTYKQNVSKRHKNTNKGENMRQKMLAARRLKGWSQRQAAEATGTTKEYYGLLENGKRVGTIPYWLRWQRAFKVGNAELWEVVKEGVVFEGKTKLCK